MPIKSVPASCLVIDTRAIFVDSVWASQWKRKLGHIQPPNRGGRAIIEFPRRPSWGDYLNGLVPLFLCT